MSDSKKKKSPKQIFAILAIIAWACLIAATLIVAFIQTDTSTNILKGLIATDIILPVIIWVVLMVIRLAKKNRDDSGF